MILDQLQQLWDALLDFTSIFVMPDWTALVGMIPVIILLLVVGPLLSLLALYWLVYLVRRPLTRVRYGEDVRAAAIGTDGRPVYPAGEPYCPRDRLVYPSGATRCNECRELLLVVCPKCGLGRAAEIDTCSDCGLVLKVASRARILRPAGPPPGGGAVA